MSENNEWFLGDTLKDPGLIAEFEQHVGYRLPEDFKMFVVEHNGCYAENELFYSYCRGKKIERVFNHLFSFNKDDIESIWMYHGLGWQRAWDKAGGLDKYIAFANDPSGNMICFDKTDSKVVFINHEEKSASKMLEKVSNSFTEFVEGMFATEK